MEASQQTIALLSDAIRNATMARPPFPAPSNQVGCMTKRSLTRLLVLDEVPPATSMTDSLLHNPLTAEPPLLTKSSSSSSLHTPTHEYQWQPVRRPDASYLISSMPPRYTIASNRPSYQALYAGSSVLGDRNLSVESGISQPCSELRRVTSNYHDLRATARAQCIKSNILSQAPSRSSLLPSPVIFDSRAGCAQSSNPIQDPYLSEDFMATPQLTEQHFEHFLFDEDTSMNFHPTGGGDEEHNEAFLDAGECSWLNSPTESPAISAKSFKASSFSSFDSQEADWLANTLSPEERRRRFNARCCRAVERSCQSPDLAAEDNPEDEKIMLATILVGPGKPKLVEIQKTPSSATSSHSKGSSTSTSACYSSDPTTPSRPFTPEQSFQELSAFSPYDTPSGTTPFSTFASESEQYQSCHVDVTCSQEVEIQSAVTPDALQSYDLDDITKSDLSLSSQASSILASQTPTIRALSSNCNTDNPTSNICHQTQELAATVLPFQPCHDKIKAYIQTVNVAASVFPQEMLLLSNPCIAALRTNASPNKDEQMIDSLSTIFPAALRRILSALAACQILDMYFADVMKGDDGCKISKPCITSGEQSHLKRTPSMFISKLASHTKTLRLLLSNPGHSTRHSSDSTSITHPIEVRNTPQVLRRKDSLAIRPRENGTLDCSFVPAKARNILGMDTMKTEPDKMSKKQRHSQLPLLLLRSNIRNAQSTIRGMAEKLIEMAKEKDSLACDGTSNNELWRAVGVVVKLVEAQTPDGHHWRREAGSNWHYEGRADFDPERREETDRHTPTDLLSGTTMSGNASCEVSRTELKADDVVLFYRDEVNWPLRHATI